MHKKEKTVVHFSGVGGIGMSGIAEVLINQGYRVTGSDLQDSDITRRLEKLGVTFFLGQKAENIHGADVVVFSSAIPKLNPEMQEARRLRIPLIPRAEMLGELMRKKTGIAIAGAHGKTTTTSLLASVFMASHLDPTVVIGGKVDSLGGNAKLGQGKFVIVEADESDGSFLHLPATYAIVTNIDSDHMDHFENLFKIENAFIEFVGKLPFYGLAVVCGEDPGVKRCMDRWSKPFLTYGFSDECDLYATKVELGGLGSIAEVYEQRKTGSSPKFLGHLKLSIPGKHNVLNALGVVLISLKLGLGFEQITSALSSFKGVRRRFDIRWRDLKRERVVIADYGHHPAEILVTLESAKVFWPGRIITVFQPHRYTRTLHCREGFLSAFLKSDIVLVMDIYSAGESEIPGVDSVSLVDQMKKVSRGDQEIFYSGNWSTTRLHLLSLFSDGDLLLFLGAGSVMQFADQFINEPVNEPVSESQSLAL